MLADGDAGVGVGDGGVVGADFDGGGLVVEVDGCVVVLEAGGEAGVMEELDGEEPELKGSVLLAEDGATLAGDGEGLVGAGGTAEDEGIGVEREGRNGGELGLPRLRAGGGCGGSKQGGNEEQGEAGGCAKTGQRSWTGSSRK